MMNYHLNILFKLMVLQISQFESLLKTFQITQQKMFILKYMRKKIGEVLCDVCGIGGARLIHVTKSYGKAESLLVIENVPVVSCPHCGESYLTARTVREIERIKRNRTDIAVERRVPVAVFA